MPYKNYKLAGKLLDHYDRDTGSPATVSDWPRYFNEGSFLINGKPLSQYSLLVGDERRPMAYFAQNKSDDPVVKAAISRALRDFFSNTLLKNIPADELSKAKMLDYIMDNLHQGGLISIVPLGLAKMFAEKGMSTGELCDQVINFQATSTGFEIIESGNLQQLSVLGQGKPQHSKSNAPFVDYGTRFNLDFSENASSPTLSQSNCYMTFNNDDMNKELLRRNLIEKSPDLQVTQELEEMPKWKKFHTEQSNIQVKKFEAENRDDETCLKQWQEALNHERASINGISIVKLAMNYNDFKTIEDLGNFFEKELLGSDVGANPAGREHLLKYFSNEGALNFVVSAMQETLNKKLGEISNFNANNKLKIVTSSSGFSMQQFVQLKEVKDKHGQVITPDGGKNHLMKCQSCVDFVANKEELGSKIHPVTVSYGNDKIQKVIDPRDITQKIYDFMCRVLGGNKVAHIDKTVEMDKGNVSVTRRITPTS